MIKSIAFGLALSTLASGSVFASSDKAYPRTVPATSSAIVQTGNMAAQHAAKPFDEKSSSAVIVADNRKEFGSTYQRY